VTTHFLDALHHPIAVTPSLPSLPPSRVCLPAPAPSCLHACVRVLLQAWLIPLMAHLPRKPADRTEVMNEYLKFVMNFFTMLLGEWWSSS